MFEKLGRRLAGHPHSAIVVWLVLTILGITFAMFGAHGESLFERLGAGDPQAAGSESAEGSAILDTLSQEGETITLVVDGVAPTADGVSDTLMATQAAVMAIPGVDSILDPVIVPDGPTSEAGILLTAVDGNGFVVIVTLQSDLTAEDEDQAVRAVAGLLDAVPAKLAETHPEATGLVGATPLIVEAVTDQVQKDLKTGEMVALPIALLVMVLVFGGFLAAAMPMAGALASIGTGLGILLGLSYLMEVDASVVNVITVLGLGLSIDYGLLIVSRFREELQALLVDDTAQHAEGAGRPRWRADTLVEQALVTTMQTAGRTVAFSGLTVAISISGLLVFTPDILRSIGAAGLSIILVAVATALTLVPALLRIAGRRLAAAGVLAKVPGVRRLLKHTSAVGVDEGVFSRLAGRVQRHPAWVAGGCVVVLLVLAAPVLGLQLRNSGIEMLPTSAPQRQFVTQLAEQFPATTSAPEIWVVTQADETQTQDFATKVASIPGVSGTGTATSDGSFAAFGVDITSGEAKGSQAVDVVRQIRALDPGFAVWVTGPAALQTDFVTALTDRVGWAIAIVVLATLILLFLMTGSLVIPVKALLTNALSIAASTGVLVLVFQEGHLSGLLGFTPTGGIDTFVFALVIAFAFGLAMDYEVFLLSRIKELHDLGIDSEEAVRTGLQRSGRIITSAASVIIVVFAGFVFGQLLVIKEVGFALAVAVFIDATIVRMLLVPATMTLLGKWNWWAPAPLRRLHRKLGVIH